jgi:hypothetical protein
MASAHRKASGTVGSVTLTRLLRRRLGSEGMKDVKINANSVDVPGGQLMATFTLAFPHSLPDDRRLMMEKIALEECAAYLQTPHSLETSANETKHESRTTGSVLQEAKIQTPTNLENPV